MEVVLLILAAAIIILMILLTQRDSVFSFINRFGPGPSPVLPHQPPLRDAAAEEIVQSMGPGQDVQVSDTTREQETAGVSQVMSGCAKQIYGYNREQVENVVRELLEERAQLVRRIKYLEAADSQEKMRATETSSAGDANTCPAGKDEQ